MKPHRSTAHRQLRPSICTSTIAVAAMVLVQAGSLAPSASATTFGPAEVPFGTQLIAPLLTDATGLAMNGGGLLLLNSGNAYTGTTTINDGSVSITAASALGADSSAINVAGLPLNGVIFDAARAGGGGNLTAGGGITLSRDLILRGFGSTGDTGALTSVGNNTFTGALATGTGASARIMSTTGKATFSGPVTIGAGTTLQFSGNGNTLLSGNIGTTGGALQKVGGAGLLEITGTNTYSGITNMGAGFLRVSDQSNLGTNTTNTAITLTGGTLEIRTDAGSFATKGLSNTTSANLFVDHAVGSAVQNQAITFRTLTLSTNFNLTLNGRNGYGLTFNGMVGGAINNNNTITNNLNGLLTFNGSFWNQTYSVANTSFLFSGNGDTLINGDILASGAVHSLSKSGSGTLTVLSSPGGSTLSGAVNINGGTIAINSALALGVGAGTANRINIGSGGTSGTLSFIGSDAFASLTVSRTVNLAGTTGGATINANQTSAVPVEITSLDATGSGNKNLTLGGTNTFDNLISGTIINGGTGTTTLVKNGPGTWALSGTNTYTGSTTISGGTLKVLANGNNIIPDTSNLIFNTNGGTIEHVGRPGTSDAESLGQLVPTAGAGTLKLTPGAGGTASLSFSGLGAVSNASSVNIVASGAGNAVSVAGVPDGFVNPHITYNGANFAIATGGVLSAPIYGTTQGFSTSATALVTGNHNEITGSFTTTGVGTADTIRSLKITGSQSLTLAGVLTINSQGLTTGASSAGGIIQSGGSSIIRVLIGSGISTGGSGNLVVRVDGVSDSLTLELISSGSGGLTKNGAGTLVLGNLNAQSGQTTINEGTIRLKPPNGRLNGGSQPLLIGRNGTLDLNGEYTDTSISSFNGEGTVTNSAISGYPDAVFTVGNNNGTGTFAGVIQDGAGNVAVYKEGTGNMTWSGLNTYTGATRISSTGIVTVTTLANGGQPSSIGASSNNAGTLAFAGAGSSGAFGGISYAGTATVSTDRLFFLEGPIAGGSGGGRILANGVNNAAVIFSNTGPIGVSSIYPQTLTLGGASTGDNRMRPQLVDSVNFASVSVLKQDAGLWILDPAVPNTYSGTTTIQNGTLQAVDGIGIPSGSPLVLGSGTAASTAIFQSNGTFTRSLGTLPGQVALLGVGSASNAGFAASSAKFYVNIGTATWGTANFLPANQALLLNSSTALSEVDLQSGIDLNGDARQIQVLDNTNTASDVATISGVISGAGAASGVIKTGAGLLNLTGANTYQGNTQVRQGTLNVTSLGQSSGSGTSSVGAWGGNSVDLGFNATSGTLVYTGPGETSSRLIRATGTSGQTMFIQSDGTGPLILTNVVTTATGTAGRAIGLGGENTGPNEIQSVLADNGGPLSIVKRDGGVWISNAAHTYSGPTMLNGGGTFGIGADATGPVGAPTSGPLGVGTLLLGNGSIMALNGDRRIINNVAIVDAGTSIGFMGDNSIIIDAPVVLGNGLPTYSFNNHIARGTGGKALIFNGVISHNDTITKTQAFQGSGDTIINGLITQTNTGNMALTLNATGGGSLKISGTEPNTYRGATTLTAGTLILDKLGAIANTGTASVLNLSGGILQATSDANGIIANTTLLNGNPTTFSGSSTVDLQGTVTVAGAGRSLVSEISGIGKRLVLSGTVNLSEGNIGRTLALGGTGNTTVSGLIQNGGSGAGGLTKTGPGSVFITGTANTFTGTTNLNGGILNVASLANGGSASSIGRAATTATLLNFNGGTLEYTGASAQSTNKLFALGTGGGTIDSSGAAPLSFTSTSSIAGGTGSRTLTLAGTNTGNNTFRPVLAVSTVGTVNLIKDGPGTWVLTGPKTYTGTTTVNAGTLLVGNLAGGEGASIASSAVQVNGGTFGGTGTSGSITATAGVVSPGASIGTLTAVSLTLNGFASLKLELDTAAAPGLQNDRLNLSGALSLESPANGGSPLNISELGLGAALPVGTTLPFITYVGSQTGFFSVSGNLITDEMEAFIIGLNTFQIDYDNGGNSVALKVVPEPCVVTSLLGGFGLLLGMRRRRAGRRA